MNTVKVLMVHKPGSTASNRADGVSSEAGSYYIGIYNDSSSTSMVYTLETQAIGTGMSYGWSRSILWRQCQREHALRGK